MAQITKPVKFPEEMISAIMDWPEGDGFSGKLKAIVSYAVFYQSDIQAKIDSLEEKKKTLNNECDELTDLIRSTKRKASDLLKAVGDLSYEVDERRSRW